MLVKRNDALTLADIDALKPQKLSSHPDPVRQMKPDLLDVIRHYAGRLPILGVCLGHRAMAQAFGGKVVRAAKVMHGKTSPITHNGVGVFKGLANPLTVTRYHSLVVEPDSLPVCFEVTARAKPARLWVFAIASGIWKACSSIQKVFSANKDINCWLISCIADF